MGRLTEIEKLKLRVEQAERQLREAQDRGIPSGHLRFLRRLVDRRHTKLRDAIQADTARKLAAVQRDSYRDSRRDSQRDGMRRMMSGSTSVGYEEL